MLRLILPNETDSYKDNRYPFALLEISKINDHHLYMFIYELSKLRNVPREGLLLHFLSDVINSGSKSGLKSLKKDEISSSAYLSKRLIDFLDTEIYELFIDLIALFSDEPVIRYHNHALYNLLNKIIPKDKKRGKKV